MNIIKYPDKLLKTRLPEIKDFSNLQKVIDKMFDTLERENALGLAANQVGLPLRLFVDTDRYYINPKILDKKGQIFFGEGCLSFPGIFVKVKRYKTVNVSFQTLSGHTLKEELKDLDSIVFQHELDHLNGVTFLDRISRFKRASILKKYIKFN